MLKRMCILSVAALCACAHGAAPFKLTGVVPQEGPPAELDVNYQGDFPATGALARIYLSPGSWRVWVVKSGENDATEVQVESVTVGVAAGNMVLHKLVIQVSGGLPTDTAMLTSAWRVQFTPAKGAGIEGEQFDSRVTLISPPGGITSGTGPRVAAKCSNKPPDPVPYFCPPSTGTPDISLSGTFTTAGGTKPLYQFELRGSLYSVKRTLGPKLLDFRPGVATKTEINQNASTPVSRTSFDPDSITAGLAFQKIKSFTNHPLDLSGIQFDETLPGGEFTRNDPTSNIIVSSTALFGLRSFSKYKSSVYGTLYPVIGMEVGRNLNKPRELSSIPVDLTHYNAIVRGLLGADGTIARKSDDRTTDVISLRAEYRVRIPANDEPLVKTIHQVSSAEMTTRARHWVEVDASASPWSFKYLAITAKYQYGDLPPAFKFVDHSFTLGLTLKAVQSLKPNLGKAP